jgi:hypothetical protein
MGWWRTKSECDDIIGDGPIDTATSALRSIANKAIKPSLQELLDALAHTIRTTSRGLIEPAAPADVQIEALLSSPPGTLTSRSAVPEARAARALEGALRAITADYQDSSLERLPRLSEVLAIFAFVLRHEPQRFLREADAIELTELRRSE